MSFDWDKYEKVTDKKDNTEFDWGQFEEAKVTPPSKKLNENSTQKEIDEAYGLNDLKPIPKSNILSDADGNIMITGGVNKDYTENLDNKGRIYYTDENGQKVNLKSNPIQKIGRNIRAFGANLKSDIEETNPNSKAYKDKANLILAGATLPYGLGAKGTSLIAGKLAPVLGRKVAQASAEGIGSGLVGGGAYGVGEGLIEGKNPIKTGLEGAGIGALGGGLIGGGVSKLMRGAKAKGLQEIRANRPKPSQYGVVNIDSERNQAIAKQIETKINNEEKILEEYSNAERAVNDKYGNIESLKAQVKEDMKARSLTGNNYESIDDYKTFLKSKRKLQDVEYLNANRFAKKQTNAVKVSDIKNVMKENKFEKRNLDVTKGHYKNKFFTRRLQNADNDFVEAEREFNGIIDDLAKNYKDLGDENYLAEMENKVQEFIDKKVPYGDQEEVAGDFWNRFYKAINDGTEAYKTRVGETPEQVVTSKMETTTPIATGEVKQRSFPQTIANAEGTPAEVASELVNEPRTYNVLTNKELTEQATKELENANIGDEVTRLMSSKDYNAMDFEKSRLITKGLFDKGDYKQAVDILDKVSEDATKKGQAIQALSLWSNMTPEGAVYHTEKMIKEYNSKVKPKKHIKLTDKDINTIRNIQGKALAEQDPKKKAELLAKGAKYAKELIPANFAQKLKAFRNISLLLNFKTLGRNIVGNALFNTLDTGAKGLAVPIDRAIGAFTGKKTRVLPDVGTYLKGGFEGGKTGLKEAIQGIDTRGLGQRYDLAQGNTRTFRGKFNPLHYAEMALDVGLRTPDRAFYEATFAESLNNQLRSAGIKEPTQEMLERAEQEALEAVFQNEGTISNMALNTRKAINTIGSKDFGLGDVVIPFAQTPANLVQQGINYSPLGLIKAGLSAKKGDQRQASLDIARALLGSGLVGVGYGLSKSGALTPSEYDDSYLKNKTIKSNLQVLGERPDQLKGIWYSPFQPMSIPLAVGSAIEKGENPLQAGVNTIVDLSFLQGISRSLDTIKEGDYVDAIANIAASAPAQFVPTGLGQIGQFADPYLRETYDPNVLKRGLNQAIAKIPYASKLLPKKIDVTGEPIERYKSKGLTKAWDILLNPTYVNKPTNDVVVSELKNLYDTTKETSQFLPVVKKTIEVDGEKIKLSGKQMSEYQEKLGQRLYNEYSYVMSLPEYIEADDYDKIKLLEKQKKLVTAEVNEELWGKTNRNRKSSYTKGQ